MSDLYDLPKDWEWKTLGDLGLFIRGVTYKKNQLMDNPTSDSIYLLRANNIQSILDLHDVQILPRHIVGQKIIQDGDILFAMSSGSKHLVGKNILINGLENYTFGAFCSVYRITDHHYTSCYYLSYIFQSELYRKKISDLSMGANINNLKASELLLMNIPLPPLPEQKRIVAKLDSLFTRIDKSIELLEKNIEETNAIMPSTLNEVFTELETKYEKKKLSEVTTKIGSGATPRGGQKAYKSEGLSLIRSMNVHDDCFKFKGLAFIDESQADKLNNVIVKENDILLNITGASVARCCIVEKDILPARVNQHVAIIRLDDTLVPKFVSRFLISPKSKNELLNISGGGATREAITKTMINNFEVVRPKITIQQKVVSYLDSVSEKVEKMKLTQQEKLTNLKALKASILDQAFKGKL